MKTLTAPVLPANRVAMLDTLRGFALFGILMVNMQYFHQPMMALMLGFPETATGADKASILLIKFLFEGKFYVIFALLFGYGISIFLSKTLTSGVSILPVLRRRLGVLLLIGILHFVLLWTGDILVFYAIFGFVLLLFIKVSNKGLVKWSIWLVSIPIVFTTLMWLFIRMAMQIPEAASAFDASYAETVKTVQNMVENATRIYSSGTFREMVSMRLQEYQFLAPGVLFFSPVVLAMFMLGLLGGRKQLIENYSDHLPFFRKSMWVGLSVGLPFSLLFAYAFLNVKPIQMDVYSVLHTIGHSLSGIFMGLFYISTLVLLASKNKLKTFSAWISPVGQMALTNYLLHSIICTTIFYGYGFGLYGKIGAFQGVLLAIVIFIVQIPLSRFWLSRFYYGPFEWLWRTLTYGKAQPFVKKNLPH